MKGIFKGFLRNGSGRKEFLQYLLVTFGSFLLASGFVLFITPYKIIPGGVYGVGIVLHYLFPSFEVGTWGFILDVPLMLLAFVFLGSGLGLKTVYAAVILPLIMNFMTSVIGSDPSLMLGGAIDLSGDVLLSCIFGGILLGCGMGLIFKSHATSGGTDIVAMFLSRFIHMPLARMVLFVDSLVIVFGLVVFGDWLMPLYALVTLFVSTKVLDFILEGGSSDKMVFILSEQREQIRDFIIDDLERGGTYIRAEGMYTHRDREMIFVIISRREIFRLQDFVRSVDGDAFMVVVNAHETLGDGFKAFEHRIGG